MYRRFGINDFNSLHSSLSPKFNRDMVFKAGEGAGRSGSFFFFSHDQRYIVKTISMSELKLLMRMLPSYEEHLKDNPDSLLCKIFGIFTVKTENFSEVHIMLMENTMRLKNQSKLKYIFDLKGSSVDRIVRGRTAPKTTLKDQNFILVKRNMPRLTHL
jgi:hypothetical protein